MGGSTQNPAYHLRHNPLTQAHVHRLSLSLPFFLSLIFKILSLRKSFTKPAFTEMKLTFAYKHIYHTFECRKVSCFVLRLQAEKTKTQRSRVISLKSKSNAGLTLKIELIA